MTILFGILFVLLLALLAGYSYYHIMQMLPGHFHSRKIAILIIIVLFPLMLLYRLLLGFFINACLMFVIFDIMNLIVNRIKGISKYWRMVYSKGFTVLGISLLLSIYGIYNAQDIKITTYDITLSKAMKDKTFVVATDMHMSTAVKKKQLDIFYEETKKVNPDMVFLIGDIYDESSVDDDIEYSYTIFQKLANEYPVYFVSGNHEVGHGLGGILEDKDIVENLEEVGVIVLDDTSIELDDMYLIGRQDYSIKRRDAIQSLVKAMNSDKAKVVLDHQPRDYKNSKKEDIDLVISGHTHGGQLFPVGQFDSLFKYNDLNYGYVQDGDFNAVVSSGMGTWGFAMRTSHHCEIVVLNIKGQK